MAEEWLCCATIVKWRRKVFHDPRGRVRLAGRASAHLDDDLACGGAVLDRRDGIARAFQRIDDGLGCGDRAGGQQWLEFRSLLQQVAGVGGCPGAPSDADGVDVVEQQSIYLDRGRRHPAQPSLELLAATRRAC